MSNHPAAGGSHLPDITVITPVRCMRLGKRLFVIGSWKWLYLCVRQWTYYCHIKFCASMHESVVVDQWCKERASQLSVVLTLRKRFTFISLKWAENLVDVATRILWSPSGRNVGKVFNLFQASTEESFNVTHYFVCETENVETIAEMWHKKYSPQCYFTVTTGGCNVSWSGAWGHYSLLCFSLSVRCFILVSQNLCSLWLVAVTMPTSGGLPQVHSHVLSVSCHIASTVVAIVVGVRRTAVGFKV